MKRFVAVMLSLTLLFSITVFSVQADENEKIIQDGFTCVRLRNGSLKLIGYADKNSESSVNIPSTINGSHVEAIGEHAFDGCKMKGVTIPDTVRMIEAFAFNNCEGIQKITIPNGVYFINGNPFTGCKNLVNISLDPKHPTLQVTSDGVLYSKRNRMLLCYPCSKQDRTFSVMMGTVTIGKNAFHGCDALESITLPATVREIGDSAFLRCTSLKNISLPESLLSIGEVAFGYCTSLSGVAIPKQISRIETGTFFNCISLTNVTLPELLTSIEDRAFYNCSALHEIYLPANTHTIGDEAFYGCASLTDVHIPVSVIEIGDAAFDECSVRLYMHLDEYAYAEIYAKIYDISFTYGNEDSFLSTEEMTKDESIAVADEEVVYKETIEQNAEENENSSIKSATSKGFMGPVTVLVSFTKDGKVNTLEISKEEFNETPGFGARALDPDELKGFIGAQVPLTAENIDALSGATQTKIAIVNAINEAYK